MKRSDKERIARDERDSYRRSEMEFGVAADAYRSDPSRKATRNGAVMVTVVLALAAFLAVLALWYVVAGGLSLVGIAVALVVGLGVLSSVHVCLEWERAVIMRLGRFNRLAGPGIFFGTVKNLAHFSDSLISPPSGAATPPAESRPDSASSPTRSRPRT